MEGTLHVCRGFSNALYIQMSLKCIKPNYNTFKKYAIFLKKVDIIDCTIIAIGVKIDVFLYPTKQENKQFNFKSSLPKVLYNVTFKFFDIT